MNIKNIAGHVIALVVGLTVELEYELVGTLRVSELIMLGLLMLMIFVGKGLILLSLPYAKVVASLGILWLASQYVSDQINHTARIDMLKGNANIIMILVSVASFVLLFRNNPNRFASYMVGLLFCRLINRLRGVFDETQGSEYWDRFIGGWAACLITLLAIYLIHRRVKPTMVAPIVMAYGCMAIVFGGRSHGLIFFMTGVGLFYADQGAPAVLSNLTRRGVIWAGVALFMGAMVMFQGYVFFGLQGTLGAKARAQLQAVRNPHNPLSVLLAGRGGIQVAAMAISDKPIMGHGSRAFNRKYITKGMRSRSKERLKMIPVHSCFFGAWVFSGILGVPFWIAVIVIHVQIYRSAINSTHKQFMFLASYLLADGMWHVFFSPYGYARFPWPPLLAVNIILHTHAMIRRGETDTVESKIESFNGSLQTPQLATT